MSTGPDFSEGPVPSRSFGERLLGALRLDATVYEEVEHTPDALGQAAGVGALAAVARGLGVSGDFTLIMPLIGGFIAWLIGGGRGHTGTTALFRSQVGLLIERVHARRIV